jgi:hypothetical protein
MKLKTIEKPSFRSQWDDMYGEPASAQDWVMYCTGAAVDQRKAKGNPDQCRTAFLAHMPLLTSRNNVRAYIACVAAGIPLGILTTSEANQMLYLAQTALSAWKEGAR